MSEPTSTLVLRADADQRIGTGHVMRCLALAQAWQQRYKQVRFVSARLPDSLRARLEAEQFAVRQINAEPGSAADAATTLQVAQQVRAEWIVADGYSFGDVFQHAIHKHGPKLLLVDDYAHQPSYAADLLLNQNLGADESLYPHRSPHTRLLLGSRYAVLRRQFTELRQWQRPVSTSRRVLLTLGGADLDNVTARVLAALRDLRDDSLTVTAVIGSAYQYHAELEALTARLPFETHVVCNAMNMPELMADADLAIAAGGSTCWELALLGLPAILVVLAENQVEIARRTSESGLTINLGWHSKLTNVHLAEQVAALLDDPERRAAMSARGRATVDGRGAERVVDAMLKL